MILLTVGTQLAFDRLVQILDDLAPALAEPVFGQIGNARYSPTNFAAVARLSDSDFHTKLTSARAIVAHAGIGTVLRARQLNKPIIVFPRRAALNEHRNDHQLATCAQLAGMAGVYVAHDRQQLAATIARTDLIAPQPDLTNRDQLVSNLRHYFAS